MENQQQIMLKTNYLYDLWDLSVQCHNNKCSPITIILKFLQISLSETYFFKVHYNIALHPCLGNSSGPVQVGDFTANRNNEKIYILLFLYQLIRVYGQDRLIDLVSAYLTNNFRQIHLARRATGQLLSYYIVKLRAYLIS